MLKNNNNIATVLLLLALAVLIWHLTNPTSSCDNNNNHDDYNDDYNETVERSYVEPFADDNYQPLTISNAQDSMINKNDPIQRNAAYGTNSNSNPPIDSQGKKNSGVFEFEGQEHVSYAGLDDAFLPPLPKGVDPDVIDINKNNVKNYDAKDFLPKEIQSSWFDTDFSQAKHTLNDDKLINTERYVIGINTVGESLKNASYDIRGTVPNPKFSVSPWNNSTYEPDYNIKPLC